MVMFREQQDRGSVKDVNRNTTYNDFRNKFREKCKQKLKHNRQQKLAQRRSINLIVNNNSSGNYIQDERKIVQGK